MTRVLQQVHARLELAAVQPQVGQRVAIDSARGKEPDEATWWLGEVLAVTGTKVQIKHEDDDLITMYPLSRLQKPPFELIPDHVPRQRRTTYFTLAQIRKWQKSAGARIIIKESAALDLIEVFLDGTRVLHAQGSASGVVHRNKSRFVWYIHSDVSGKALFVPYGYPKTDALSKMKRIAKKYQDRKDQGQPMVQSTSTES